MKTVEESKPESLGIKRLWHELQLARKDGKKLLVVFKGSGLDEVAQST